ncbi:MAG: hypothetical protein EXR72_05015, partial [Myxococcales bacterium]|nr:hypothetical protein [Myxococcales bacterium]
MNRSFRTLLIGAAAALSLAAAGCGQSTGGYIDAGGGGPKGPKDLTFSFETEDLAGTGGSDDAGGPIPGEKNGCMDQDPSCAGLEFDPANQKRFPLSTDKPADPNQANDGVGRDVNGFLVLDSTHASFDYLWGANSSDWSKGTVSKINSKTVREVGRYFTVTCNSLLTGNKMACDGKNGCCAMDSYPQFQNRQQKMPEGVAQQVLMGNNYPSRTSVDFNGDLWVANRAFGGQSSVTKICNDLPCCKDRNKNGKIDTSKDVDGDGLINSDCNMNNTADDLDDVKGAPCQNGMAQEFYGLDDECILLTTNTNVSNSTGRPLTLGPGALDFGPSDAYPGSYNSGKFFRI